MDSKSDMPFAQGFLFTSSKQVQHVFKATDLGTGTKRRCLTLDCVSYIFVVLQSIPVKATWIVYKITHVLGVSWYRSAALTVASVQSTETTSVCPLRWCGDCLQRVAVVAQYFLELERFHL